MKKLVLFLALLTTSLMVTAKSDPQVDLQKKWGAVIHAIAMVESQGQPNVVSKNGPRRTLSRLIERTAVRLLSESAISAGSPV